MSYLGPVPKAVEEPVRPLTTTSDHEGAARLPLPATVRLDRVVWLYVITVSRSIWRP